MVAFHKILVLTYPIFKHIGKPPRVDAQPKACQRAYKDILVCQQGIRVCPRTKKQNKLVLRKQLQCGMIEKQRAMLNNKLVSLE